MIDWSSRKIIITLNFLNIAIWDGFTFQSCLFNMLNLYFLSPILHNLGRAFLEVMVALVDQEVVQKSATLNAIHLSVLIYNSKICYFRIAENYVWAVIWLYILLLQVQPCIILFETNVRIKSLFVISMKSLVQMFKVLVFQYYLSFVCEHSL